MKNTSCPTAERLLVGVASEDRMLLEHSADCPRCAEVLRDTAGLLVLLEGAGATPDRHRHDGGASGSLSLVAAVLLVVVGLVVVSNLQPVVGVVTSDSRGGPSLRDLSVTVRANTNSFVFDVEGRGEADEMVLELWNVDQPQPMEVKFEGRSLAVEKARVAEEVGTSVPVFWLVRGYRNGREVAVSSPQMLLDARGAGVRK